VIVVTETRAEALARLDVFVGEWVAEARFPGGQLAPSDATGTGPIVRSSFEWALDRQFLLQRTDTGAWETGHDGGEWEHDFALTYRRAG
jgi:hypothetical protein